MENWKTIITFTHPEEAHLAKGYLDSEGIETVIQDEMTTQVNHFFSNAIGGVKLLIKEQDYETALKSLKKGGYIIKEETQPKKTGIEKVYIHSQTDKAHCPYCHSDNFNKVKRPHLLSIFGLIFFQGFLPLSKSYYHCYDCQHEWIFKMKKQSI